MCVLTSLSSSSLPSQVPVLGFCAFLFRPYSTRSSNRRARSCDLGRCLGLLLGTRVISPPPLAHRKLFPDQYTKYINQENSTIDSNEPGTDEAHWLPFAWTMDLRSPFFYERWPILFKYDCFPPLVSTYWVWCWGLYYGGVSLWPRCRNSFGIIPYVYSPCIAHRIGVSRVYRAPTLTIYNLLQFYICDLDLLGRGRATI